MFIQGKTRQGQKVIMNMTQIISVWEHPSGYVVVEMPQQHYEFDITIDGIYRQFIKQTRYLNTLK